VCACARVLLHNNSNIKFYIIVIMIVKNIRTQILVCVCVSMGRGLPGAQRGHTRPTPQWCTRGVCVSTRVRVVDAWLAGARAVTGTRAPRGASNARVLPNFYYVVLNFLVPLPLYIYIYLPLRVCVLFIYTTTTCVPVALQRRDSWLARGSFGPEQFGANSRG